MRRKRKDDAPWTAVPQGEYERQQDPRTPYAVRNATVLRNGWCPECKERTDECVCGAYDAPPGWAEASA